MAILYFLGNSTESQMLGCVIQTEEKTIVIDGGTPGDAQQLTDFLRENANSNVDAWFFTHPHHDHIGAFTKICKNNPEITIHKIYCRFPSVEMLKKNELRSESELAMWVEFENLISSRFCDSFCAVEKGDVFEFDQLKVNVLRVFNENIISNFTNNSSAVYRIDSPHKRILILGDLGVDAGNEVMKICSAQSLQADYTQLSHHGQDGVSKEFYEYINPRICLWASPEWLWNNDRGDGFDTGPWKTVQTRQWMKELGVTEHIVEKDGITKICF